jgi:hypothetical protein
MAFGPRREDVRLAVRQKRPQWLEISIGPPESAAEGSHSLHIPVTIRVPPGAPAANLTGPTPDDLALVLFDTGHADVPQLRLLIRLTVPRGIRS